MRDVVIAGYLRTAQSRSRPNDPARDWFCKMRSDELLAKILPEVIQRSGVEPEEIDLIKALARYPDVVSSSARGMEPHRITYYLMNLASAFHSYYNKHRVLVGEPLLRRGRLNLILAVQKVIRNGLTLLGVSAPQKM